MTVFVYINTSKTGLATPDHVKVFCECRRRGKNGLRKNDPEGVAFRI